MVVAKDTKLGWLPPGWKVEEKVKNGRKVRCFVNVKSAQRFYSKVSVLRHIRKTRVNNQRSQSQLSNGSLRRSDRNKQMPLQKEPDESLDWLPPGWTMEVRTRKSGAKAGLKYKCFIEPSTGNTFYSKPEVSRYLKGKEERSDSSETKKSGVTVDSSVNGSVRPLSHHKSDPGQLVHQHPKSHEGKSQSSEKRKESLRPLKHHIPDLGVPQHPKSHEETSEPSVKRRESLRPLRHRKLDPAVPQHQNTLDDKSELSEKRSESLHPLKHYKPDPGQQLSEHPKSHEEKSEPLEKRKESLRPLRHHKPDPGQQLPEHPKSHEENSEPLETRKESIRPLRHHKSDPGQQLPKHPHEEKSEPLKKRKESLRPLRHHKLDPGQQVPAHQESHEVKSEPSEKRKESLRPLRYHKPDPGQQLPEHSKNLEEKSEPSEMRKESLRPLRHHKPDLGPQLPGHPESHEEKSDPSEKRKEYLRPLRYHKPVPGQQLPERSKSQEEKSEPSVTRRESLRPLRHHKPNMGQQVPDLTKSHEEKSEPSETKKESVSPLLHHKPDLEQPVPQHPKSQDGKDEPSKKTEVIIERVIDEGLPPGWIKEIRIKKSVKGVRRDSFYADTTTGYVFRSRLDVLRFLETGEVSRHAYKRRDSSRNILQLTQGSPSTSAVGSNTAKVTGKRQLFTGKGSPEGSSLLNRGNSIVGDTDSGGVLAGNNAVLDLEADVNRLIPFEAQKTEGNENDTVRIDSGPAASLKDIFPEDKHEGSSGANTLPAVTESVTVPSKNEFLGAERSMDKEEFSKRSSRSRERKPKRNRKETVSPFRSSKRLAGIEVEPVTHSVAIERVLRSTSRKSAQTEVNPSLGSEQLGQAQEAPLVINMGLQEEIVPASPALLKDQATEETFRRDVIDQTVIDLSWNSTGGQMAVEPTRNNVEHQMFKEPPANNSKERFTITDEQITKTNGREKEPPANNSKERFIITDEQTTKVETNGRGKEQQDSPLCFPWSDPCIEFAYKTLTGAITLDDSLAIHDYVQHQMRTSSSSSYNLALPEARPPGFSQNIVPSSSSNNFALPDAGPSGFSRSTFPSYSGNNITLPDARPPGFSQNAAPSDRGNSFALPDAGPPGFSRNTAPSNSGNNLTVPDARPPGFPRSMFPSNSGNNLTVSDARPPGFPWSMFPSSSGNNLSLPDARPPGFSRSIFPSDSGNNPPVPDARPPGFSRGIFPSNNDNSFAIPDARPPGFSLSIFPSNSDNNFAIPDARPPGFTRNFFPSSLTLTDAGPPGFSEKIVPSSKQQQQTNPAGPHTQPADFALQKGAMFSPWDLN